MSSLQLTFTLRTSPNAKTVHLVGNWDAYKGQLPLSKDPSKSGSWKGTFRFSGSTLHPGVRYWYYFIIDGYHVSHDPAQSSTTEPTTGRKLNILDVPKQSSGASRPALSVATGNTATSRSSADKRSSRRVSTYSGDIPHGRGLSPSKIKSPVPQKPHETRHITHARYSGHEMDRLSKQLAGTKVSSSSFSSDDDSEYSSSEIESDGSSDLPSLSSGGSSRGSPSSLTSPISPPNSDCSCGWDRDRKGQRFKLPDCGGSRCGSPAGSASASSDSEEEHYRRRIDARDGASRRHGVVVRGGRHRR